MDGDGRKLAIVETGATHCAIVHAKAGDADDVQRHVGRGTQSCDVAGVGWDLRFDERDGKHEESIGRRRSIRYFV